VWDKLQELVPQFHSTQYFEEQQETPVAAPQKNSGKNFSGNFLCKIRTFSGKNHVILGNFVNFSGKCNKNSDILIIFLARIM